MTRAGGRIDPSVLLVAPLTLFLLAIFLVPVAGLLSLAVTEASVQRGLPRTVEALRGWSGTALPDDAAFGALAADLAAGRGDPALMVAASRLNQDTAGLRGAVLATARAMEAGPPGSDARAHIIAADPAWAKVETWGAIRRTAGPLSDTELLAALDLRRDARGVIGPVDPERAIFRQVLLRTLATAALVTMLSLALGYPLAALLARVPAGAAGWLMLLVLLPLWTGVLVRTAAWMALLARHGPVNQALLAVGLFAAPRELLFTRFAVVVAMLHILLPYMILPLYAVMRRIPEDHLRAAASLGAAPARAFWRVWLPQTAPGIAAGVLLVFIQALGAYVTPALLGGGADQMLPWFIGYAANQSGEWGLAAALSLVLLVAVGLLAAVWTRIAGLAARPRRMRLARPIWHVGVAATLVFLAAPVLVIIPLSLNPSAFLQLGAHGFSARWYEAFLADPTWRSALANSLIVAAATTVLATALGAAAAIGIWRRPFPGRSLVLALAIAPLAVPTIVTAIALTLAFAPLGLANTRTGLVLGHTVLAVPLVVLVVLAGLRQFDPLLLRAAASCGAAPGRAFRRIMLPLIGPGIAGGAVLAFAASLDESVLVLFLAGPGQRTLPRQMFAVMHEQMDPTILAAASVLVLAAAVLMAAALLLGARSVRSSAADPARGL